MHEIGIQVFFTAVIQTDSLELADFFSRRSARDDAMLRLYRVYLSRGDVDLEVTRPLPRVVVRKYV